jgi:hypothetical protein
MIHFLNFPIWKQLEASCVTAGPDELPPGVSNKLSCRPEAGSNRFLFTAAPGGMFQKQDKNQFP